MRRSPEGCTADIYVDEARFALKITLLGVTSFEQAIRQTTIRGDYRDNSLTWSYLSEFAGSLVVLPR